MRHFLSLSACLMWLMFAANAQEARPLWQTINKEQLRTTGQRDISPEAFVASEADAKTLWATLTQAPLTQTTASQTDPLLFWLPAPDGSLQLFALEESPMMEDGLAKQFPEIKTWAGVGISDPGAYMRCDMTPRGFHAMVLSPTQGTWYIDPFCRENVDQYMSYRKADFIPRGKVMACGTFGTSQAIDIPTEYQGKVAGTNNFINCQLRHYRLALACTGEYAVFHSPSKVVSVILGAMVTSINRVNTVYMHDFAIQLNLIANNSSLIYTTGSTDPYDNNDGSAMLSQNQSTVNTTIGSANYDIGHVFSTGGGGIASLGSVCSSSKAQGVTGSPAPVGDPFDIDYVAHEVGHQFGAEHTFNSDQGSCCCGNRSSSSSYEPGSGSTIMAYAGICSPDDVQNNSDAYFHYKSIEQVMSFVVTGTGSTCDVLPAYSNTVPAFTSAQTQSFTIPASTPFMLTAAATDANGDTITYCWEQYNNQISSQPPVATSTTGPNFRSYLPTTYGTRMFPTLNNILDGTNTNTWEVLPTVARTLNFRVTIRDNHSTGGCREDASATLTSVSGTGPFKVTSPNTTGVSWAGGTTQTVTWDVAGTTANGINCANVDIYLSTNNGTSFLDGTYTVLATAVPNNGSATITVPNLATTNARIMVKGSGNVFFDINDKKFTITQNTNIFSVSAGTSTLSVCQGSASPVTNTISVGGAGGAVTLSASGVPAGATATFSPSSVTPAGTSSLLLNAGTAVAGTYTITVTGTRAGSTAQTTTFTYTINANPSVSASNVQNVLCFGTNNGSLSANGSGGSMPYTFQLNNGAFQSSGTFNNLAKGTYTLTIKDNKGCTGSTSVTLTGPSAPIIPLIANGKYCTCTDIQDGGFTVNTSGGTSPYQYAVNGGALSSNNQFTNLATGTYNISIQDANGCTTTTSYTIGSLNQAPTANFSAQAVSYTVGFTNLSSGATSYSWNFGDGSSSTATAPQHTYAQNGNYTVILTATNACGTSVKEFTVGVVSVEANLSGIKTSLHPNPASQQVVLSLQGAIISTLKVQLTSMDGKVLFQTSLDAAANGADLPIDLSGIASGLYMVRISGEQGASSMMLSIQ